MNTPPYQQQSRVHSPLQLRCAPLAQQEDRLLKRHEKVNKFFKDLQICNISVDYINHEITFTNVDGVKILMYHKQDCCEQVEFISFENLPYLFYGKILGVDVNYTCDSFDREIETSEILEAQRAADLNSEGGWGWIIYTFKTLKGEVKIVWFSSTDGCSYNTDVNLKYVCLNDC